MYFNKNKKKKTDQIYLWNLYHTSDLILQQNNTSKLHTPQNNQLTQIHDADVTHTHTQSNNSFLYESLWNRDRERTTNEREIEESAVKKGRKRIK